jgi:hypothetical protein
MSGPTLARIAGNTLTAVGAASNCRPPWLETIRPFGPDLTEYATRDVDAQLILYELDRLLHLGSAFPKCVRIIVWSEVYEYRDSRCQHA